MVSRPRIIKPEILDELLKDYQNPEDLLGEGGILKQLTKALVERCLNAELLVYLEEEKKQPDSQANRQNGYGKKTFKGAIAY
jgi:transposase-like protein